MSSGRAVDVAPTMLYGLGLPLSRELAGTPLTYKVSVHGNVFATVTVGGKQPGFKGSADAATTSYVEGRFRVVGAPTELKR